MIQQRLSLSSMIAAAAAEVDAGGAVRLCMTSKSRFMRRASSCGSTGVGSSLRPTRGWLMRATIA